MTHAAQAIVKMHQATTKMAMVLGTAETHLAKIKVIKHKINHQKLINKKAIASVQWLF